MRSQYLPIKQPNVGGTDRKKSPRHFLALCHQSYKRRVGYCEEPVETRIVLLQDR